MKKIISFLYLILVLFLAPAANAAVSFDLKELKAVIDSNDTVEVSKNIIFDGTESFILPDLSVRYEWDLGDGTGRKYGQEIVHTYNKPGQYTVTLTVTQGRESSTVTKNIFVYQRLILMLTDASEQKDRITKLAEDAKADGIYINLIESYDSTTAFLSEETLASKLAEQVPILNNASSVVIWTTKGSGINSLTRLVRERSDVQTILKEKTIVVISDRNLNTLSRIMQTNFDIMKPKQIVVTRQYELRNLIEAPNVDTFLTNLQKSISEYVLINEETSRVSIWNSISYLVNFMITKGIPSNTIVLLLMLPVIATLIAFLKQVVGITTFGLYTPSIITLSFLALGLKFGLIILVIIILSGAVVRLALDRFRLLHIPRIAIILTITSLILLLLLAFGTYLNISQIASIAVFPMLIMTTLAEKFVSVQSGKGLYSALLLMVETTVVSLICYWVVELQYLQNLILAYPEIILLLILVNYVLGRWTGLRVMEYVRFREIMKHAEEE